MGMTHEDEARDPNTSPERLAELLVLHAREVFENPVFSLLFLEDPTWLERLVFIGGLYYVLDRVEVPAFVVAHLSQSSEPTVREVARMHHALGPMEAGWEVEVAQRLAALDCSNDELRTLHVAGLVPAWLAPWLPPVLVEEALCVFSTTPLGRLHYATKGQSPELLTILAWDNDPMIVSRVAANPATPDAGLACILARQEPGPDLSTVRALAEHPNLTETLAQQIEEKFGIVAPLVIPLERFLSLVLSQKIPLRFALRRTDAPLWLKGEAIREGGFSRVDGLAWFCGLLVTEKPTDLTAALSLPLGFWYLRFAVAIHPLASVELLQTLQNDVNRYVRAAARARLTEPSWEFRLEGG